MGGSTERSLARGDQELLVPFRSQDRAFDDAEHRPARLALEPSADAIADFLMQRGIAHHATLADAVWPYLELRLDERDRHAFWPGQGQGGGQHGFEADEAGVAYDPVDRLRNLLCREM